MAHGKFLQCQKPLMYRFRIHGATKLRKPCLTASDAMMMPAMADLKIASTAASLPHITPLLISDFTAQPLQSALPHCWRPLSGCLFESLCRVGAGTEGGRSRTVSAPELRYASTYQRICCHCWGDYEWQTAPAAMHGVTRGTCHLLQ